MSFPSLPSSVDRYVREILNRMLGRTGNVGDRVVFESDLVELGIAQAKTPLNQPVKPGTPISAILDPSAGAKIPDNPTTPAGLSAAGTFGAVILQWTPPVYKGHNHSEIWRAQVDVREQATLVHEANGSRYADVIGSTTAHYYWIRHVNSGGQTSGFNQLPGILGQPTAIVSVDDLRLEHPEILTQPFSVINRGTEETPDYAIVLNGDIAVNGIVNISQLQSGELQNGQALTIGQGSIELATASDGYGQIIITGQGGIAGNDYLVIKQGRIESFVYTESAGHVRYKEVRRSESGTAASGQQVKIPAYFKSQPQMHLYPRDVSIYNAAYPTQSQRLEIFHTDPEPHPDEEGAWLFTPYARLVLAAGSDSEAVGWTYSGSGNDQSAELSGISNLQAVTVYGRAASNRHSGSGNTYQNRQVTMYLYYRLSGSGSWSLANSTTQPITQFGTVSMSLSKTLSQNTYDIQVRFVTADRSGTFTSGQVNYEYTQSGKSGSGWTWEEESNTFSGESESKYLSLSVSNSGWEITRIDYQCNISVTCKTRGAKGSSGSSTKAGEAIVKVPDGSGGQKQYGFTGDTTYVGTSSWNNDQSWNETITWSDTSYKDGKMRGKFYIYTSGVGYTPSGIGGPYLTAGYAYLKVSNVSATVYYRRIASTTATTYNTFYFDSATYNRGATDVSIADAVITWTAQGE